MMRSLARNEREQRPQTPRWLTWVGYAAAVWSLGYGVLGLRWARSGAGFPFGRERDPDADAAESILADVHRATAAPVIAWHSLARRWRWRWLGPGPLGPHAAFCGQAPGARRGSC